MFRPFRTRICSLIFLMAAAVVLPAHADNTPQKALDCLTAGDTLSAINCLKHCDLEGIRDPQWFVLLGQLHRGRGTIVDRLKSQYVLERAVQLFPNDPGVLQELGMTYFSRTFYPDAARSFKKAIEIDPSLCETRYKLGVTYYERWKLRVNAFWDDAVEACEWLGTVLECDSNQCDAAVRYVNVQYALARADEARAAAKCFARRFPTVPEFPMIVGAVAFDYGLFTEADSAFHAALSVMEGDDLAAYTSLDRNVLGYDALDLYEDAKENEQTIIDRAFWINGDPDPTTDLNERFLEHVYRTFRADVFFSNSKVHIAWTKPQTRGWNTERGEISIKFGWPDNINASYGGDRHETWTYYKDLKIGTFVFTDQFLNGNLQVPSNHSTKLMFARHDNRMTRYEPAATEINGAVDAVVFKDDDLTSSVYITAQVNADSIIGAVDAVSDRDWHLRTRFFYADWEEEHTTADTLSAEDLRIIPGTEYRLFDFVSRHQMSFDLYAFAFAFEDERQTVLATFAGRSNGSRLIGDALTTSDVLWLREGSTGASFVRGDQLLLANPWGTYGDGQLLRFYFEIYNLSVADGRNRYRITYEIIDEPKKTSKAWNRLGRWIVNAVTRDDKDPLVAQSFVRVGSNHQESEKIAIDIGALDTGSYRLNVSIEDLLSGGHTNVDKSFYKAGAANFKIEPR